MPPPAHAAARADTLAAFIERDPDGIRAFYREYGRLVYAVAWRILTRVELAEAATRETFVRALHATAHVDPASDPAVWLQAIAETVAREIAGRELETPRPPKRGTVADIWKVRRAIQHLPDDLAAMLRLHHDERLTPNEISERLGLPLAVVESGSRRAYQQLGTWLADDR